MIKYVYMLQNLLMNLNHRISFYHEHHHKASYLTKEHVEKNYRKYFTLQFRERVELSLSELERILMFYKRF